MYEKLEDPVKQIRIVNIRPGTGPLICSLDTVALEDAEYEALSYCWGDEAEREYIELDGQWWPVMPNLYEALKILRPRRIWIDAICINQQDDDERGQQVSIMGEIYANAQRTIAWLGPSNEWTQDAFAFIQFISEFDLVDDDVEDFLNDVHSSRSLLDVFQRPYWSRIWTIQEYLLSPETVVQCGKFSMPSLDFARFRDTELLRLLASKYGELDEVFEDLVTHFASTKSVIPYLTTAIGEPDLEDQVTSFHALLHSTQNHDCRDDKDKLYGILSIASLHSRDRAIKIQPQYHLSTREVYQDFAVKYITGTKSLAILEKAGLHRRHLPEIKATWIPDLAYTDKSMRYFDEQGVFNACDGMEADCYFGTDSRMSTYGFKCDTIAAIAHPTDPRRAHKFKAVFDFVNATESSAAETLFHLMINTRGPTKLAPAAMAFCFLLGDMAAQANNVRDAPQNTFPDWYNLYAQKFDPSTNPPIHKRLEAFTDDFPSLNSESQWNCGLMSRQESISLINDFWNVTRMNQREYTVFRTRGGFFGCSSDAIAVGDHVFVLPGAMRPFVLRNVPEGFQLIDYCFVHGMMDGEMIRLFQEDKLEMQAVTIV